MTYSLVARDPKTGQLGVAAQSHFFGVGRLVGWVRPGVGALATQAFPHPEHGRRGLELLTAGASAAETIEALVASDDDAGVRQLGCVDAAGGTAAFTGAACLTAAGHVAGHQVTAQGNMLAADAVWGAMLAAYERADGDLAARMLAALNAAEAAGGDIRGRQSASILVMAPEPARPELATLVDCRVDDHPEPLVELGRLVTLNGFYTRMLELFSEEGVLGGPLTTDQAALTSALEDLAAGREILGVNQEATFWQAVLLARVGREGDATELFASALAVRPELAEFLWRIAPSAFPDDPLTTAERLVGRRPATGRRGSRQR